MKMLMWVVNVYMCMCVHIFRYKKKRYILLDFYAKSGCQIDVCGYYFGFFFVFWLSYCFFFVVFLFIFFYSLFNFFLNWKTAIVQLLLPQILRHTTGLWFSSRLRYFACYVPIYTYIHILTLIVKEETSVKTVTNLCRH